MISNLLGLERFRHDILRPVQPAVRLLSELGHQSEEEGLGVGRRGDRRPHAQAAGWQFNRLQIQIKYELL